MIELKKTVHTTLRERAYPYTSVRRSAKIYVIGKNKTVTETGNPRNEIIFPALMSETSWKVMYSARRRPRYLYCFIKFIQKFSSPKMRNRQFVFAPKIEYELVAERGEANQNSLTFPFWCAWHSSVKTPGG